MDTPEDVDVECASEMLRCLLAVMTEPMPQIRRAKQGIFARQLCVPFSQSKSSGRAAIKDL